MGAVCSDNGCVHEGSLYHASRKQQDMAVTRWHHASVAKMKRRHPLSAAHRTSQAADLGRDPMNPAAALSRPGRTQPPPAAAAATLGCLQAQVHATTRITTSTQHATARHGSPSRASSRAYLQGRVQMSSSQPANVMTTQLRATKACTITGAACTIGAVLASSSVPELQSRRLDQ